MDQWKTAVSVTRASELLLIQRQYVTSSGNVQALTFVLVSRLKIWRDFAAAAAKAEESEFFNEAHGVGNL